jgi:hypothetical protein
MFIRPVCAPASGLIKVNRRDPRDRKTFDDLEDREPDSRYAKYLFTGHAALFGFESAKDRKESYATHYLRLWACFRSRRWDGNGADGGTICFPISTRQ